VARFEQIGLGEPADGVHSRRTLVRGALFVAAVAVIAGAVVGHFIWSSTRRLSHDGARTLARRRAEQRSLFVISHERPSPPASEKGATAAYEAPAHGTPPRETPADETPADQSPPAESRPAAETNTEPVASAEPSASAPELDSDPQPASSDGSPSFSSSESAAGAGFQLTAEAPPGGPLERPTVPVFESIPAPSDVPAQHASEAEGEEPALGRRPRREAVSGSARVRTTQASS
jgi:type IV secretory pathway VirB10-like protein